MKKVMFLLLLLIPIVTAQIQIIGEGNNKVINLGWAEEDSEFNQALADTLYASIIWGYNQTGDGGDGVGNESWNETYANDLYVELTGDTMTGDITFESNNARGFYWKASGGPLEAQLTYDSGADTFEFSGPAGTSYTSWDSALTDFTGEVRIFEDLWVNNMTTADSVFVNQSADGRVSWILDTGTRVDLELTSDPFANAVVTIPPNGGALASKTSTNVFTAINYFTNDVLYLGKWITHYGGADSKFGFPSNDAFQLFLNNQEVLSIDRLGGRTNLDLYDADIEINASSSLTVNGNTYITDNVNISGTVSRKGFYYSYRTSEYDITTANTWELVDLDTIEVLGNIYSESGGNVSITEDGVYRIDARCDFDLDTGTREDGQCTIYRGGIRVPDLTCSTYARENWRPGTSCSINGLIILNDTQGVQLYARGNTNGMDIGGDGSGIMTRPATLTMEYVQAI